MGGRLLPLLALEVLLPLLLPPGAAGLQPAELTEPPSPRPPSTLSPGRAQPPRGSWDPGPTPRAPTWLPSPAASRAVEVPSDSTAAERTPEGRRREHAESPATPRSSGQSAPATTAATEMPPAWLSRSASPAAATAHGSGPSPPSGGFSTEGVPGGRRATSPSQGWGTGVQVDTRPPAAEPRSKAPRAAGKATPPGTVTAPPSLSPVSGPRMQGEGAGLPHVELLGPSPAAGGRLVAGAPLPGPVGEEEDIAALPELTHSARAAPQAAGPETFLGSEAYGHPASARPPEPSSAVGLPLPGAAPPSSSPAEDTTPVDFPRSAGPTAAPRKMPLGQRTSGREGQGPALTPSQAVRGPEATPHFAPSSPSTPAASAPSPDSLLQHPGHAPEASQSAPWGHGGLSTGPTGETGALGTGRGAWWSTAALPTSTDPGAVPGREPLRAPDTPGMHGLLELFSSTLSGLAQSSPNWATARGTSSNPASSSRGPSPVGTARGAGVSSDSPRRPPMATPRGGLLHQAASSRPAGETTATAEPTARLALREGETAAWRAETPASSAPPAWATREDPASSEPPRPPSQAALFSSSTSAAGGTEALGPIPVTHPSWSAPGRTWQWGRGGRTTSSPSPPLPTVGKTWHTWPPARGDPPVASTWLLAVMPEAVTQLAPATPGEARSRIQHVFVAENQPPVLRAPFLHLPWELALTTDFPEGFGSPNSPEYRGLLIGINATVAPLLARLPGFQRLEVKSVRGTELCSMEELELQEISSQQLEIDKQTEPGSVLVLLDAVFLAEAPGLWAALNQPGLPKQLPPELWAGNTSVIAWSLALQRPLDLCAELFSCPTGYDCVVSEDGNATCASVCHRPYCKNQGICTHAANQPPVCQCPVGSDFWFLGVRCDYRVTQQGLLGGACGLLLSLLLIGAAVFGLVVRRVRTLLLEARADQTKSSYRRFCRLDDVSAHYWSEPWLASVNSLDNPAFSHSEELLHLQTLEPPRCSCQEGCPAPAQGLRKPQQGGPSRGAAGRPRSLCSWERSSGSGNEHMIDSGKASEVSVSSWPVEPIQWSPSPAPHGHARQPTHKGQRPHSYCEGMELVSLERSWTA